MINKLIYAYKKGPSYTINYLIVNCSFLFLRFFKVSIVRSKYNIKLYADYKDATFKYYYQAKYGFFLSDYLKNYHSKFTFIDIGANQGLFTILAAKNTHCEKVVSFEPVPSIYESLKKNSSLNDVSHKCDLQNLALSDKCGEIEIPYSDKHSGAASLVLQNKAKVSEFEMVKIRTINAELLESIFSSKFQNYVLKVDVEGYEFIVLTEIFKCNFSKFITSVFYEVDEEWEEPDLLEALLRNNGFANFKQIGYGTHYDILATKNI